MRKNLSDQYIQGFFVTLDGVEERVWARQYAAGQVLNNENRAWSILFKPVVIRNEEDNAYRESRRNLGIRKCKFKP